MNPAEERPQPTGAGASRDEKNRMSAETGDGKNAGVDEGGAGGESTRIDKEVLKQRVVDVMKSVFDPEIPVNIYELGMVYDIDVDDKGNVNVTMTLTSPSCPVAGTLPGEVEVKVNAADGVRSGKVELVWDPPWTPEKMSEAAKLQLGMM